MSTGTEIALSDIHAMHLFALDSHATPRHATHGNQMTPHGGHEFWAAFHALRFHHSHHPHHSHHSPVPTLKG